MLINELIAIVINQYIGYYTWYLFIVLILSYCSYIIFRNIARKKGKSGSEAKKAGFKGILFFEIGLLLLLIIGNSILILIDTAEDKICKTVARRSPNSITFDSKTYFRVHDEESCTVIQYADTVKEIKDTLIYTKVAVLDEGEIYKKTSRNEFNELYLYVTGVERRNKAHLVLYRIVDYN